MSQERLDRKDWIFYAVTFGVALAFLAGVYGAAYLAVPEGWVFSGMLHDTHDALGYQVWANYYQHGGLLADNPYALTRLPPTWFNLTWWVFGKLMALGVPFYPAYHLFRALAGALLFLLLLRLMRDLVHDRVAAWTAYLFAGFGTGFTWLVGLFKWGWLRRGFIPSDIAHGDSFPFNAFWTFPHLALSWAMLVGIYLCMYRAATRGRRAWAVGAGLIALPMGFVHPYHFVTILPVLGLWYAALQVKHGRAFLRRWPDLALLFAGMLPGLVYYLRFLGNSPNFSHWSSTNVTRTTFPSLVLLGFGIFAILPLFSWRGLAPVSRFTDRYLLVAIWPLVNLAAHFSYPFTFFDSRLGEGLLLPLAVLSSWALFGTVLPWLFPRRAPDPGVAADILEGTEAAAPPAGDPAQARFRLAAAVAVTVFAFPTTLLHVANQFQELRTGEPWFRFTLDTKMKLRAGEADALAAFGREQPRDFPIVLSGPEIGLLIPGYAPVRAFVGHVTQTTNFQERMKTVAAFYGPYGSDEDRRQLLRQREFAYVWWGVDEDRYGGRRPQGTPWLVPVYNNGTVTLYRVDRAAL